MAERIMEDLEIQVTEDEAGTVLSPMTPHLDSKGLSALVREYIRVLSDGHGCMIIDLRFVKKLSFAACAFLQQMHELACEAQRGLAVRNVPGRLRAEMDLYHLDQLIVLQDMAAV